MIYVGEVLKVICLTGAVALLLAVAMIAVSDMTRSVVLRSTIAGVVVFCLSSAVSTIYAGYKQTNPKFVFEDGLKDDGSYATNSLVHVSWVLTLPIPASADLYVEYREKLSTNAWEYLARTKVGAYQVDIELANATNYNYNVWYDYVPPPAVQTNGVWKYETTHGRNGMIVPFRARVDGDGKPITPVPSRKAKEVQE